ncbi:MAG: AbrB/MazE/SpoVT family DNA-binding domain-containing protein [Nitrososphaerales archaeon]|nr:AbrB/MazE/SpoVT family DNA-binding domain-containing protein [Nitrososphaerales archaeon]
MGKLVRVSSKGQVVIPAGLRRKLSISKVVLISEKDGKIMLEPSRSMEEAFGTGGTKMLEAAREISGDRRREVESGRP